MIDNQKFRGWFLVSKAITIAQPNWEIWSWTIIDTFFRFFSLKRYLSV